jgi:hypothetical protein
MCEITRWMGSVADVDGICGPLEVEDVDEGCPWPGCGRLWTVGGRS